MNNYPSIISRVLAQSQTLKDITSKAGTNADLSTVVDALNFAIKTALALAGVVGVIMIMYASVLYVISFGDESKAETAKKTLLWSIIGVIVVALAWSIVYFVDVSL